LCFSNTLNDCVSDQIEISGRTAQPKVSIDSFHLIIILGEGFEKVILVKKKASDESDQRFVIKVMKKYHIINYCSVTYTIPEREALVLALGHPLIMTMYSFFQKKGNFQIFFNLLHFSGH